MIQVRPARFPDDRAGVLALDTSVTTDTVYRVAADETGIRLYETKVGGLRRKRFPLDDIDDPDRPWDAAWVAAQGERIVGFAATGLQPWNGRLVIWHLYVDTDWRGQGIGLQLLDAVMMEARNRGARSLWLETSSLNVPGVAAYRAMGFSLTGVDLTLYDGTPAEGEAALFLSLKPG